MTPKTEWKDLLARSRRLLDAALLLLITFALLIVAAGTLFCVSFTTVFTMGRNTIDRMTARVTVEKGAEFHVLPS
ncbi:MAG: hypothetical protein WCV62_05915 [Candidatus Peribacteraceae bacterium]|jgi:hypothetical protein